jgi:hypothetical protein
LFLTIIVFVVCLVVETAYHIAHGLSTGSYYSFSDYQKRRAEILAPLAVGPEAKRRVLESIQDSHARHVVHPYVGYVVLPDPEKRPNINDFGYIDPDLPVRKRSDDEVIIGIVGGSLAAHIAVHGDTKLRHELAESPAFAGRKIRIVCLALGGYKQPQQLMTVAYLLSLGAEFDIIVNVDGFNEVALYKPENGKNGIFPAFPRSWQARVPDSADPVFRSSIGLLEQLRSQRTQLASTYSATPWRHLGVANNLWMYHDGRLLREIQRVQALAEQRQGRLTYMHTGLSIDLKSDQVLHQHLVDIWRRGSVQLNHLCRSNGIL